MQSLARSPHLTQSLDPTHHSVTEPNPTQSNPAHGWNQPISGASRFSATGATPHCYGTAQDVVSAAATTLLLITGHARAETSHVFIAPALGACDVATGYGGK